MKKLTIIASGIITSIIAFGQPKGIDYAFSSFDAITVDNGFEVTVIQGEAYKVNLQVEEPYAPYVTAGVNGRTLDISLDERSVPSDVKKLYKGKNPVFTATVITPRPVESITLKGSTMLAPGQSISTDGNFTLALTDNASVDGFRISAKALTVKLEKKSSATIDFVGEKVSISTAGNSSLDITRDVQVDDITLEGLSNIVSKGSAEEMTVMAKGAAKAVFNGKVTSAAYTLGGTTNVNSVNLENRLTSAVMSGLCSLSESATDSLKVNLSSGAKLTFDNDPAFIIDNVKSSSLLKYNKDGKK